MVHPSPVAVEYIWECFSKALFNENTQKLNEEIEAVLRATGHRPFDATSDGYRNFLCNLLKKIEGFEEKYPYLNFDNERMRCNTLLNK
jgi:hypothetical protein